jgi:hypothetical protein
MSSKLSNINNRLTRLLEEKENELSNLVSNILILQLANLLLTDFFLFYDYIYIRK